MISKNNITRSVSNLKQLIRRCESYGEFDKDGNLHLPIEKTESSFLMISKEKLIQLIQNRDVYALLKYKTRKVFLSVIWSFLSLHTIGKLCSCHLFFYLKYKFY